MRKYLNAALFLASQFLLLSVTAQTIQRDLLAKFSLADIKQNLILQHQWKPFPLTTAEWKLRVPDSVQQAIIKQAERGSAIPFTTIPATVTLEYVRTGNRVNFEKLSFEKETVCSHWYWQNRWKTKAGLPMPL